MKRTHFIPLIAFFLVSLNSFSQKTEKKDWQQKKQEMVSRMDEDRDSKRYVEMLSSIVSLDTKQQKELEKVYREYHKIKLNNYQSKSVERDSRFAIKSAQTDFVLKRNKVLTLQQQQLLQDFYSQKQQQAKERIKRAAISTESEEKATEIENKN